MSENKLPTEEEWEAACERFRATHLKNLKNLDDDLARMVRRARMIGRIDVIIWLGYGVLAVAVTAIIVKAMNQ